MSQDARIINRVLKILEPLQEDPQGQMLSRNGAMAAILEIVNGYVNLLNRSGLTDGNKGPLDSSPKPKTVCEHPRPKMVHEQLLDIAEKAKALDEAIFNALDISRQAAWETAWEISKVESNSFDLEMVGICAFGNMSLPWIDKLRRLEYIHRRAAADPRLKDKGGPNLRAEHRWYGTTPNHWVVRYCRALLGACGKSCSGSTGDSETEKLLVTLLAAVRKVANGDGKETTFNNDISEVMNLHQAALNHDLLVANYILSDLRRRRPVGHSDIQEAERVYSDIRSRLIKDAGQDMGKWRHIWA